MSLNCPVDINLSIISMNNNDLNLIANDLLTAFFDQADATRLVEIANKYQIPIAGKIFKKATERAISWLESADTATYDLLTPENRDRIIANGLKNISEKFGATLGKDFSKVDDGLLITDELMSKIMADMSPRERSEFQGRGKGFAKKVTQDPFKMLEDSWGVPFFNSLEAIAKLRCGMLSDDQAGHYLSFIAGGMQGKHNWITDNWIASFFIRVLGKARFESIMSLKDLSDSEEAGGWGFEDLLIALGSTENKHDPELGAVISREQVLLLDKVYRGENYSCAELAEQLRRLEDNHRKK